MRERLRQFREAGQQPTPEDLALGREHLPPALFDLFAAQHPRDVVHSAATARWLLTRGHDDAGLVTAAFLHDIAKGHQRRADRAAWVAASTLGLGSRLAGSDSRFEVRRAMARTATHSEVGAQLLASAGASSLVVSLTRLHHSPPGNDPMLALLQQADAAS